MNAVDVISKIIRSEDSEIEEELFSAESLISELSKAENVNGCAIWHSKANVQYLL